MTAAGWQMSAFIERRKASIPSVRRWGANLSFAAGDAAHLHRRGGRHSKAALLLYYIFLILTHAASELAVLWNAGQRWKMHYEVVPRVD